MPVKLRAFIVHTRITATAELAESNPNMPDSAHMDNWTVTLKMGRKRLTVPFSMGKAIAREPNAEDVLDCLASDAASIEIGHGFEDWADGFGYSTDSRKAEQTYKAIVRQSAKLRKFLGAHLYNVLVNDCERL